MKKKIRNRINPAELGVGKLTKNGDLILICKHEEKDNIREKFNIKFKKIWEKITKFGINICIGTELKYWKFMSRRIMRQMKR
jgi:hypothetical protein